MIYYFFIAFCVFVSQSSPKSVFRTKYFSCFILLLMICLVVAVGLLNPMTGDMMLYIKALVNNSGVSLSQAMSAVRWEPGFVIYQWFLSKFTTSYIVFISLSILIMWFIMIVALKKILSITDLPLLMFGYISFFYFYGFATNVLRQGLAIPFILLMIVYLGNSAYKKALVAWIGSLCFHYSAFIAAVLLVVRKLNLSIRFLLIIYGISALLLITGTNEKIVIKLATVIGRGLEYYVTLYSSDAVVSSYGATNRIDFFVFTTFWIFWGVGCQKWLLKKNLLYEWILKTYISLSNIYLLFGFVGYSDRVAAYAWFLIPILLVFPAINLKSRYRPIWVILCTIICLCMFLFFNVSTRYQDLRLFY